MTAPREVRAAIARHTAQLQRQLSVLTPDTLVRVARGGSILLRLQTRRRLRASTEYHLQVEQLIQVGPSGAVEVRWYRYQLLDEGFKEILAFHNHRGGQGPHLHIGAGAGELFEPLYKAHVPTGRVALAEVALMLVRDFGVEPLRADWEAVLNPAPA